MCHAFSCLMTRSGEVYWKRGVDSHDKLWSLFKDQDRELADASSYERKSFAFVEVTPAEGYLHPEGNWTLTIDERGDPDWWTQEHADKAKLACEKWREEVYALINLEELRNPLNPLMLSPVEVGTEEIALLREWASLRASLRASLGDSLRASLRASLGDSLRASLRDSLRASLGDSLRASLRDSLGDSLRASLWASLGDSLWDSLWASLWAYWGSLFYIWPDGYPYQCAVDLWRRGLLPSCDGTNWRLHSGPDAKIVWEGQLGEKVVEP